MVYFVSCQDQIKKQKQSKNACVYLQKHSNLNKLGHRCVKIIVLVLGYRYKQCKIDMNLFLLLYFTCTIQYIHVCFMFVF